MRFGRCVPLPIAVLGLVTAACAEHRPQSPVINPGPTSAPGHWGKIVWGEPVNGLQIGIVYWNETHLYKSGPSSDLYIDLYFRNVS
jgi:hypothetical protein